MAAGVLAATAHGAVTYTFTGIDHGVVEMATYTSPVFASAPTSVAAGQLGWCGVADSMAVSPPACAGLSFDSAMIDGVLEDVLTLTRTDGVTQTPSTFLFAAGTFGKAGMARSLGANMGILSISGSAAPEPASWMMLIAGFGLIGTTSRRARGRRDPAFAPRAVARNS